MNVLTTNQSETIANYLNRVQSGLKRFDEATQQEILSEIKSHLDDRVEEFRKEESANPVEDAVRALGDPAALAQQFSEVSVQQKASRSFLPWVLLRAAARMAAAGARGLGAFFIGLVGYVTALAFFLAAFGKVLMPDKFGFWVGPHGVAWGAISNTAGAHEVAGGAFIYISLVAAFVIGSATTLLLRWLVRPSRRIANLRQRPA